MFGAATGLAPSSAGASSEGIGLPVSGESLPLNSVSEALFVEEAIVIPATPPVFPSAFPPTDAPSFGDWRSEASPSAVLYHWHWKSFFQISAGSGSAVLVSVSGWSVDFAVSS